MFESMRTFFVDRKRKIFITLVISGASYYTYKKIKQLTTINNAQKSSNLRLKTYFEQTQQAVSSHLLENIPGLYENIANIVDVPQNEQLKVGTKEERVAVWERLAVQTLTRLFSGVYSVVLVSLMLRLQINLISRYTHRDGVEQGLTNQNTQDSIEEPLCDDITQEKYLAHSEYLVKQGLEQLCTLIQESVQKGLEGWSLTKQVTYEDMLRLILSIRSKIESSPPSSSSPISPLLSCLLPPENQFDRDDQSTLGMLLGETRNMLESDYCWVVFRQSLDSAFLQVTLNIRESFQETNNTQTTQETESEQTTNDGLSNTLITLPMAKVIPVMRKQFNFALQAPTNGIVEALAQFPPLNDYSYDIFSKK